MIEFLGFLCFVTMVFILPSTWLVISGAIILIIIYSLIRRINLYRVLNSIVKISPFMLLTFVFNVWLADFEVAVFISLKLLLVCYTTFAYAQTLSVLSFARTIAKILSPLRAVNLDANEITLIIALALSLIPIIRKELMEVKCAIRAKGMTINLSTARIVVIYALTRSFRRIDELDMALRAKGVFS